MLTLTLQKELSGIETQIQRIIQKLSRAPEGKVICTHNGPYPRYLHSVNGHQKHIKTKERDFARELAYKHYLELQLADLTYQKGQLQKLLSRLEKHGARSESLLSDESPFYPLLNQIKPQAEDLSSWQSQKYESNPNHPEGLIYKTYAGHYVRSKSEVIIANYLFFNRIPYLYEFPLTINNFTYYPDFTIRHPKTGEIYYWEHMGLMDDPAYANKSFIKLKNYNNAGIIPTINLICTYETSTEALDTNYVEQIISYYFGDTSV